MIDLKFFVKREFETAVELRQKLFGTPLIFSEGIDSNKFVEYSNQSTDIGLIYCDYGLKPYIVYLPQVEKLFLGINSILSYYRL